MANELNCATGQSGQTLIARLFKAGAQVGSDINMTEVSSQGGYYSASVPNTLAAGVYFVLFLSGGNQIAVGQLDWNGTQEMTLSSIASAVWSILASTLTVTGSIGAQLQTFLGKIAGSPTIVTGPVATNPQTGLTVTLTVGDDYYYSDNRSIDFSLNGLTLPSLSGASCYLVCTIPGKTQVRFPGSVVTETGATRLVRFQPNATETAAFGPADGGGFTGVFHVRLITAANHTITPLDAVGQLIVLPGTTPTEIQV
jgi:hypothetical protein